MTHRVGGDPAEKGRPKELRSFGEVEGSPAFERITNFTENAHGQRGFDLGSSNRPLWRPNRAMRDVHAIANRAMGFILWSSNWGPEVNARNAALNGPHLYIVDLSNAFGCVDGCRLAELFANYVMRVPDTWGGTAEDAYERLNRYFLSPDGGLYQGGPASQWLFEFYVRQLVDTQFEFKPAWIGNPAHRPYPGGYSSPASWAYLNKVRYSRYADDLVFASRKPIGERKRAHIKSVIREAGFKINERKTRGVVLRKQAIELNGIGVRLTSRGGRTFLPRMKLRTIEGLLHKFERGGDVPPEVIHGYMGIFKAANPSGPYNATEKRVLDKYGRLFPKPASQSSISACHSPP